MTAVISASTLRVDVVGRIARLRDPELRGHNGRSRPPVADGNGCAAIAGAPRGAGAHRRRGWLGCRPDRTRLPVAALLDASGGACVDIAGATASTYTAATTDSRSTLRVLVVATSAAGAGGAISAATPVIP